MKYGVWCTTSGGVTGHREAWAKHLDGKRLEYDTIDEARAYADQRCKESGGGTSRGARFTFTAREIFD